MLLVSVMHRSCCILFLYALYHIKLNVSYEILTRPCSSLFSIMARLVQIFHLMHGVVPWNCFVIVDFNKRYYFVWLRITDEGCYVPEMRIWSILLIKSNWKWCIRLNRNLFYISSISEKIIDKCIKNLLYEETLYAMASNEIFRFISETLGSGSSLVVIWDASDINSKYRCMLARVEIKKKSKRNDTWYLDILNYFIVNMN